MIHYSKRVVHLCWIAFLTLIVIFGIFIASLRLLLPQVSYYHSEIEQWASGYLGQQVTMGHVNAKMQGFFPELQLNNITIINKKQSQSLHIKQAFARFSLIEYLKTQTFVLTKLTLSGLKLPLKRLAKDQYEIAGFKLKAGESGYIHHELFPYTIKLTDAVIELEDQVLGYKKRFSHLALILKRKQYHYQLSSQFNFLAASQKPIKLMADFNFTKDSALFKGKSYFSIEQFKVAPFFKKTGIAPDITATTNIKLWSLWNQGMPFDLQGEINTMGLKAYKDAESIRQLNFIFNAKQNNQQWQIKTKIAPFNMAQNYFPEIQFNTQYQFKQQQHQFILATQKINLALLQYLNDLPAFKTLNLVKTKPQGILSQFKLLALWSKDQKPWWQLSTRFNNIKLQNWQKIAGIGGLSGQILVQEDYAKINLKMSNGYIQANDLFKKFIPIKEFNGEFIGRKISQGWLIKSNKVTLNTVDFNSLHRFLWVIPEQDSPYLDWQGYFNDIKGKNAALYYPKATPKTVLTWLTNSIIDVHFPTGSGIFRGYLSDYPFKKKPTGHFELNFDMENGLLNYYPDFPSISKIKGQLHFSKNQLLIQNTTGQIYNSPLQKVNGVIKDVTNSPYIHFNGKVAGNLPDYMRFLLETPLKERFKGSLDSLKLKGPSDLNLTLDIPLRGGNLSFQSELYLQQNQLEIIGQNIHLKQIKGQLNISDKGINADNLSANYNQYPITVNVQTPIQGGVLIAADARLGLQGFLNKQEQFLLEYIKGQADWHLSLQLPPFSETGEILLNLSSDLKGIESRLPAPFNKKSYERKHLNINCPLQKGLVRLNYADQFSLISDFDLRYKTPRFYATNLHFGGASRLPVQNNLLIDGTINKIKLEEWAHFLEHSGENNNTIKLPPLLVDLAINQLKYKKTNFGKHSFNINQRNQVYKGKIKGDMLEGRVDYFKNKDRLAIDLKRLSIDYKYQKEKTLKQQINSLDPRKLSEIDIKIEQFFVNGFLLGKFNLDTQKEQTGLRINQLDLMGYQLKLDIRGLFYQQGQKIPEINLKGDFSSPNMGKLIKVITEDIAINKGAIKTAIDLTWITAPSLFNIENGRGHINLRIEDGQFTEVDSGNAGRLINILNLGGLIRKVRLDLDTVKEKGFSFEKLSGHLELLEGNIFTQNLEIKSNTADILIKGKVELATEKIDLALKVTPHLTSTLPLAATLVGGPLAGAALLIAQKVLGKQVDKISELTYTAKGTWKNVELKSELIEELKKQAKKLNLNTNFDYNQKD